MQPGQPSPHCPASSHGATPRAADSTRRLRYLGAVWWLTATAAAAPAAAAATTIAAAAAAAAAAATTAATTTAAATTEHRELALGFPPAPPDLHSGGYSGDLYSPQLNRRPSRRAPTSLPATHAATRPASHPAARAARCAARHAAPHLHAPPSGQAAAAATQRTPWPAGQEREAM